MVCINHKHKNLESLGNCGNLDQPVLLYPMTYAMLCYVI